MNRRITLGALLVALVTTASTAFAQQQESIKVHGAWTIEIRNPDGTLVSTHNFSNALVEQGQLTLLDLLTGTRAAGFWAIQVSRTATNFAQSPCPLQGCVMIPVNIPFPEDPEIFKTLSVGPGITGLVLAGHFTALQDGVVGHVQTQLYTCQALACGAFGITGGGPFTAKTLPQPISVSAGQMVQIRVNFNFSS